MEDEERVIIVGGGTSGLATAACLYQQSIPYILLEREDCYGSIWSKYSYDRLHLHLVKQICQLPHMPFPPSYPKYVPKQLFLQYLKDYVSRFHINPLYRRRVDLAQYDDVSDKWVVKATNVISGDIEEYTGKFLVVATGGSCDPYIPQIQGLNETNIEYLHSTRYKNGERYIGKHVLVVGAGNSGMEIALDLANYGAITSILIRSPIHIFSRWMMELAGKLLFKLKLSRETVDWVLVMLSKLVYGDLSKYGIRRPKEGPLMLNSMYNTSPLLDLGTCSKIKSGEIQVLGSEIESIKSNEVVLKDGKSYSFDTIIFCTGFKTSTHKWLKGGDSLLNDEGFSKNSAPNNYKGENGLYCVGLSRRGIIGASLDAQNITDHIHSLI